MVLLIRPSGPVSVRIKQVSCCRVSKLISGSKLLKWLGFAARDTVRAAPTGARQDSA
jgi:hypothetical protein